MTTGTPGAMRYPNAPHNKTVEVGNAFEDYVCDRLAEMGLILRTYKSRDFQYDTGENKIGWEIKRDPHTKYGHLSIEVAEKSRADLSRPWVKSGILRNDNSWLYIHGDEETFWVLFKPALMRFFYETRPEVTEKFGTLKTFYLEYEDADKLGIRITA